MSEKLERKSQCEVKLLHFTPLWVGSDGTRTCWDSGEKSDTVFFKEEWNYDDMTLVPCSREEHSEYQMGEADKALIDRVGNKYKHASTLEHLYYNFHIKGISRACLQELARHRIASPSVKSTRYTLKELKSEEQFNDFDNEFDFKRASKYVVWTGNHDVDITIFFMLEDLRDLIAKGISNDIAKFALPEAYKTELAWSINARSLQNFLALRTNKAALWEIRELAYEVYDQIPQEHKFLFEDTLYQPKETEGN